MDGDGSKWMVMDQTGKRPAQKRTILHELVVKLPYFLFLFYGFIFPLGF